MEEKEQLSKDAQIGMAGINRGSVSFAILSVLCFLGESNIVFPHIKLFSFFAWTFPFFALAFFFVSLYFYDRGIKKRAKELEE